MNQSMKTMAFSFFVILIAQFQVYAADDTIRYLNTVSIIGTVIPVNESRFESPSTGPFSITFATVETNKYKIGLSVPKDENSGGSSLERFYLDENPVAVMVGGFIDSYAPATPTGLLRINKRNLNALATKDITVTGIVCFRRQNGEPVIAPSSSTQIILNSDDCFQSGPLLVHEGKSFDNLEAIDLIHDQFSAGHYRRSFFLKNGQNRYLMGITTPIYLFTLRHIMLMKADNGGFGAISAIGLPGLQWGGLMIKAGDKPLEIGRVTELLPDAITVTPR